jgi:hypothetical protein
VQDRHELQAALAAASEGALDEQRMAAAEAVGLSDEHLLNPAYWKLG